ALRLFAAGSVDGGPLPPQRQHVLGGEGSLPGSLPFAYDCGARRFALQLDGGRLNPPVRSYPYYGCDRVALFQAEYLGRLPLASAIGRVIGRDLSFLEPGYWSLFFNTGRAWIESDARNGRTTGLDEFVSDVGFGLRLGQLGVYWARPMDDVGRPGMNFFVRIGPGLCSLCLLASARSRSSRPRRLRSARCLSATTPGMASVRPSRSGWMPAPATGP